MQTEAIIRHFIAEDLLAGKRDAVPDPDESLISAGILDSAAVLTLLTFVEKQFGVTIDDTEVTPANFGTINRITKFVESKAGASA